MGLSTEWVPSCPGFGAFAPERRTPVTIERYLRGIAGTFILITVLLAHYHSPYWLFFTAFVGLNLLQSAFTNWCPMMTILRKLGVSGCCQPPKPPGADAA